jgi:hypothetical protein
MARKKPCVKSFEEGVRGRSFSSEKLLPRALLLASLAACSSQGVQRTVDAGAVEPAAPACPVALPAPHVLPGTRPEHREPGFWISRMERPDEVLLTPEEIEAWNVRVRTLAEDTAGLGSRADLLAGPVSPEAVVEQMRAGLDRHMRQAEAGERVFLDGRRPPRTFFDEIGRIQRSFEPATGLHLTHRLTPLRCHPTEDGLYEYAGDIDFDLLLCSMLRPGELVQVVSRHSDGWVLIRSPYAFGWTPSVRLGPEIAPADAEELLRSDRFVVVTNDRAPVWRSSERREQLAAVSIGLRLPLISRDATGLVEVRAPSSSGIVNAFMDAGDVHEGYFNLTRREVVTQAFRQLDDSFGWADYGGDRDCSRFLMDLFALFGLHLPRNSTWQSRAAPVFVDSQGFDAARRVRELELALTRGIPLVFMPGHIMLLLGRDGEDLYAIHQFSGYRVGCLPGHDIKMVVDRVSVTTLRLGEGSERRSFLDRFTRISIIAR